MDLELHGSPHSLPTCKVALMARLCALTFRFRYVSFQKGWHRRAEFLALSRWGQVPVLVRDGVAEVQSSAIIERLAVATGRFDGADDAEKRTVREWLWWEADTLFPPIFACYGLHLGERGLLPITLDPVIATYHREKAALALSRLEELLADGDYLCGAGPTIADVVCLCDLLFAVRAGLDVTGLPRLAAWRQRLEALPGYADPFDLLAMRDLLVTPDAVLERET